jgi:hypothetical protein
MDHYKPTYKMPGGAIMALLAIIPTGILLASTFLWAPIPGLIAAGLSIVTGIPFYYYFAKKNRIVKKYGVTESANS